MRAQMGFDEIDEDYKKFVDNFKPKKTTDDCYTPPNIFEAVKNWVVAEYGIDGSKILRPFYPGGDYKRESYPEGCTVVDNPPFSILTEIVNTYMDAGVKFFLFAPHLTNFSVASGRSDVCRIIANASITYENGAVVNTSFVTNLDSKLVRSVPDLNKAIKAEDLKNRRKQNRQLPKYAYPEHLITAAMVGKYAEYGVDFSINPDEGVYVRYLDAQKMQGNSIFGGGYLISNKAAAEKAAAEKAAAEKAAAEKAAAEKAAAKRWELSDRELQAIEALK